MIIKRTILFIGCLSLLSLFPFYAFSKVFTGADTIQTKAGTKLRVVLDPGHGGKDSATRAGSVYEKHLVLSIANVIKARLERNGFNVVMTREGDEFVPLSQRALTEGDVFVSLHANTVADTIGESVRSMIKGMEIYTSKNMERGSAYLEKSKQLASTFHRQLSVLRGINVRSTKEKSLAVLNQNQSPAILIELGFISNKEDLAFLTNPANYHQIAEAFVRALKKYQSQKQP